MSGAPSGDNDQSVQFIEQAFVYNLPWAMEAVRVLYPFGEDAGSKLHIIDGLAPTMRTIRMPKDPACSTCGQA